VFIETGSVDAGDDNQHHDSALDLRSTTRTIPAPPGPHRQYPAGAGATRGAWSTTRFTVGGVPALSTTDLATLDQVTGTLDSGDIIRITGTEHNGTAIAPTDFTYTGVAGGQTIDDLIATISSAFSSATATYENGRIVLTDDSTGASSLTIGLEFVDQGLSTAFELGGFNFGEVGRDAVAQMVTTAASRSRPGRAPVSSTNGKAGQITAR
jgi:hypothetical protein